MNGNLYHSGMYIWNSLLTNGKVNLHIFMGFRPIQVNCSKTLFDRIYLELFSIKWTNDLEKLQDFTLTDFAIL